MLVPDDGASKNSLESMTLAQDLLIILLEARRIALRPSKVSTWAREIRRLYVGRGANFTFDEVRSVMDWFKSNVKAKYTPAIYSASTFRSKFPALLEAMHRDVNTLNISKEAKDIVERLQVGKRWPEELEPQVELQLRYAKHVFGVLKEESAKGDRFAEYLLNVWGSPSSYVTSWMEGIHEVFARRIVISAKIGALSLNPENAKFRITFMKLANEYGKSHDYTKALWRKLNTYEG